ncbi:dipeptidyl aminopeptidases/acylaminoacyl-peptidase [Psychroflexus torquis ATCC 700755]|uniref:Dipeptidyl aminopeptidases/acylaminoacyl-peptidase n=1 Tax=Psychroflexus torquis (strain ATCC 700755 / CIP 106069 / ACAM 623) TaxID=313595 RepID=K4IJQ7_PSYTT|nr:prolyl oligopeptidase family serine peptidase [Psychroflexus torquis]AFU70569.1 dipeptidyl aminopeptidases/acylaminoacyl-peptidase [Psychroflexus torquis ATCC 700755]
MKILKRIAITISVLTLSGTLFLGLKFGMRYYKSYQNEEILTNTILDNEISSSDYTKAERLKNGQILSKKIINLSEILPIWTTISENDSLLHAYKYLDNINFYVIVYKSDLLLVNGIIAEPKKEGRFPVIIFNRGGNKEIGKVAKAKTLYSLITTASKLADEDYLLIASCYREEDEIGGDDLNDVLNLTETIKSIDKADATRIGMYGWSRGGMMTYLSLKNSTKIKTAVVGNGPSDLEALIIDRPEMDSRVCAKLIPEYDKNKTKELQKRSVINWADELDKNASLLILCGTEDEQVHPNQADLIAHKLEEINYDFKLEKVKTDHTFSNKKEELNRLLLSWFKENL